MRTPLLFVVFFSLAACSKSPDPNTAPAQPRNGPIAATTPLAVATASGEVTAVDAATGKVTIAHGPVAALNWPEMTMSFRVEGVDLTTIRPGDRVEFEFRSEGMNATIIKLTKQ